MGLTSRWVVNPMDFMKTVDKSVKDKAKDLAEQVFDGVVARRQFGQEELERVGR